MSEPAIFRLPFPVMTDKTAGRLLRGHQMGPIKDGWLLVYENTEQPPDDSLIDELCIVKARDNRILVRFLRKGHRPDTWDLLTVTGPPELDAQVIWAARVTAIIPHKPTQEEIDAMVGAM